MARHIPSVRVQLFVVIAFRPFLFSQNVLYWDFLGRFRVNWFSVIVQSFDVVLRCSDTSKMTVSRGSEV